MNYPRFASVRPQTYYSVLAIANVLVLITATAIILCILKRKRLQSTASIPITETGKS